MPQTVRFTLNGQAHESLAQAGQSLLDHLRHDLGLMATKMGCGAGQCGACHVLLDGKSVPACDTPMEAVAGKAVITLEGLGTPQAPHRLQTAFIAEQALQCGYCTSGLIVSAAALLDDCPQPSEAQVRAALDGHLCRCGVHQRVVRAVMRAAHSP